MKGGVYRMLTNFQRYVVLRLGKFPNKLRYFLRKYPAAYRPSAFLRWLSLPSAYPYNPTLIFSLSVGGWRGGRIQGFPDKYARSEARGRFIGKRRSRLTF